MYLTVEQHSLSTPTSQPYTASKDICPLHPASVFDPKYFRPRSFGPIIDFLSSMFKASYSTVLSKCSSEWHLEGPLDFLWYLKKLSYRAKNFKSQ